ncbi:MAG TPA: hypothetical protein VEB23_11330 [Ramlibacter sp.]|nr:hypothetical protein [Ramlibacter sp.]
MNSQTTPEFWDCYRAMPPEARRLAVRAYRIWRENPRHPGLHFKRVHPSEPIYAARVGIHWRALGLLEGGTVTWFWIGSHADYDRLTG